MDQAHGLTRVDRELLDRLVAQSDAHAGGRSTRDLERLRDDCLVSILQALRTHGVGAGEVLAEYERTLLDVTPDTAAADLSQPLRLHTARVPPEWVDYNGHAHESRYLQVVGDATDALLRFIGVDADYVAAGGSYFTVETHLSHLDQARADDRLHVTTRVLGCDEKRLHVFHQLYRSADDALLATGEHMLLHVDTAAGRAGPARQDVRARAATIAEAQAGLPMPPQVGRSIGARRA